MKWIGVVFSAALVMMPIGLRAGTNSTALSDNDRIHILLEYNRRLVRETEKYLRERPRIPADYQGVSDKEYLRRYKLEKPLKTVPPDLEIPPADDEEKPAAQKSPPHLATRNRAGAS